LETESLFIPVLAKEGRITRQPSLNGKEMNSLRSNGASKPKGRPGKSWWPSSGGGGSGGKPFYSGQSSVP
jgi:hypothetical protein